MAQEIEHMSSKCCIEPPPKKVVVNNTVYWLHIVSADFKIA
jgi:hypothetical protein